MHDQISWNLQSINQQIVLAAEKSGRDPAHVTLVAVSKKKPVSFIRDAFLAGQKDFGENYVQELLEKQTRLKDYSIKWHFVGHLQRKKVKDIVGKVDLIHSLDSIQLAYEIDKRAMAINTVQKCLVQINLAQTSLVQTSLRGEKTKSGVSEKEAIGLLKEINLMKNLDVVGLMTLPPALGDPNRVRPFFRLLKDLRDLINSQKIYRYPLNELSMGMSEDFTAAIEEGATFIRIGTAIFGERATPDDQLKDNGFMPKRNTKIERV